MSAVSFQQKREYHQQASFAPGGKKEKSCDFSFFADC
jgi:hypothetical protein